MQPNPLLFRPMGFPLPIIRPATHTVGLGLAHTQFDTFHRAKSRQALSHASLTSPGAMTPQSGGLHEFLKSAEIPSSPLDNFKALIEHPGLQEEKRERRFEHFDDFSFKNAKLHDADFTASFFSSETDFSHSHGFQPNFTQCDLPSANFNKAVFSGANFNRAYLKGALFNDAILENTPRPRKTLFEVFTAPFNGYPVEPTSFKEANLFAAQFKNANLKNCNFKNANLSHADFENANLQDADLTGIRLMGANFKNANLKGAKISLAATIETELLAEDSNVPKAVMELAELAATHNLDLGLNDPKTTKNIKDVFQSKTKGHVTEDELEDAFRLFYQQAERESDYEEASPKKYIPFIFQKINDNIFDDLNSPNSENTFSRNSSFEHIDL